MLTKIIKFVKTYQSDIVLALAIVLISVTAFNLGKLSVANDKKFPITITESNTANSLGAINGGDNTGSKKLAPRTYNPSPSFVVASKASKSRVYHFPWCSGASRISEKNKITFPTEATALAAGYTLAGNCSK